MRRRPHNALRPPRQAKTELAQKVEKLESREDRARRGEGRAVEGRRRRRRGELAQLKGTYDKLEDKMKDEIAKGDIRLSAERRQAARRPGRQDPVRFGRGGDLEARRGRAGARRRGAGGDRRQADPGLGPHRQHAHLREAGAAVPDQLGAVGGARDQRRALSEEKAERARRSAWSPAATASTTRSPATRPRPAARATAASRSC